MANENEINSLLHKREKNVALVMIFFGENLDYILLDIQRTSQASNQQLREAWREKGLFCVSTKSIN